MTDPLLASMLVMLAYAVYALYRIIDLLEDDDDSEK